MKKGNCGCRSCRLPLLCVLESFLYWVNMWKIMNETFKMNVILWITSIWIWTLWRQRYHIYALLVHMSPKFTPFLSMVAVTGNTYKSLVGKNHKRRGSSVLANRISTKSKVHQMTLKWPWTLQDQRYSIHVPLTPQFQISVSFVLRLAIIPYIFQHDLNATSVWADSG